MNLLNDITNDILLQSAQNSRAWDKIRLGRFTGSGIGSLFVGGRRDMTDEELKNREKGNKRTTVDLEFGQTAITYIEEKAMEFITGEAQGEFSSRATEWGNEWEEHGLLKVAEKIGSPKDKTVLKPRFVTYGAYSGASPDAYMEYNGERVGAELKCPFNSVIHLRHSRVTNAEQLKNHDADYYWQIQGNMFFHKMPLWLFASFDPRQPEHRMLHIAEIYAVPSDQELMLKKLEQAEAMKQEIIQYWLSK